MAAEYLTALQHPGGDTSPSAEITSALLDLPPKPFEWYSTQQEEEAYYLKLSKINDELESKILNKKRISVRGRHGIDPALLSEQMKRYQQEVAQRYERMMPNIQRSNSITVVDFTSVKSTEFAADK